MANKIIVRGYKGFENDMTCRGFQYEPGKVYEMDGEIKPCERGFHFCRNAADVFNYYERKDFRYADVEALGEEIECGDKSVTNKIRIVRELTRTELLEAMYTQEGLDFEDVPFPADEIIRAREAGTLSDALPSGTEFPVHFANGEKNILVVGRDSTHTYLITKFLMAVPFTMNETWMSKGGWPACRMRKHVNEIYNMLSEDFRRAIVPMHIRQTARSGEVECIDNAFLLSRVNVYGKKVRNTEVDCNDTRIDIFRKHAARFKKLPGASSASWWWLRSAYGDYDFYYVNVDSNSSIGISSTERGVVVAFCIEDRTHND